MGPLRSMRITAVVALAILAQSDGCLASQKHELVGSELVDTKERVEAAGAESAFQESSVAVIGLEAETSTCACKAKIDQGESGQDEPRDKPEKTSETVGKQNKFKAAAPAVPMETEDEEKSLESSESKEDEQEKEVAQASQISDETVTQKSNEIKNGKERKDGQKKAKSEKKRAKRDLKQKKKKSRGRNVKSERKIKNRT